MSVGDWVIGVLCVGFFVWSAIVAWLLSTGRVKPSSFWGYSAAGVLVMGLGLLGMGVRSVPWLAGVVGPEVARVLGPAGAAIMLAGLLVHNNARRRLLKKGPEDPPLTLRS